MKIQINKICKDFEITQANLARELGISCRTLQNIQYGKSNIKLPTFLKLLKFVGGSYVDFSNNYLTK